MQSNFYHNLAIQVNANDEGGVVKGRWSGDYLDGIEPWAWTGSTAMLEEYMKTRRPVKYGQCWNFCGVLTTCKDLLGWSPFGVPVTQHCLKHARIRVFSDPYFLVFLSTILTWYGKIKIKEKPRFNIFYAVQRFIKLLTNKFLRFFNKSYV